ncbi:helix-turn-helix transcriptional regulator [Glaciihabitans sp. dw_435]|uniref:ArsR/SmtB family transcription factor n=1 Tax=Glaciihabitans sp. dw_435 TaxID=2720081 RepID=UPI001BD4BE21|nr:metalloregulator ArsR/SmtB family transcription factor [Glaciihabitans sp. dw_435]
MSARPAVQKDIFFAVGDSNRRRILELLSAGERSVGELAEALQITQASTSQHLTVLRDVGVVDVTKRGTSSIYRLQRDPLAAVIGWIAGL